MIAKNTDISDAFGANENFMPRRQGFESISTFYYEKAFADPNHLEVWVYTDRLSYRPGDVVCFHASTTAVSAELRIVLDGKVPREIANIPIEPVSYGVCDDYRGEDCRWPEAARWQVPDDSPSGLYIVTIRGSDQNGYVREHEHAIIVRPAGDVRRGRLLLVAATCTWQAYNDWGGANHYYAAHPVDGLTASAKLSVRRPYSRGFIWLPNGAPRKVGRRRSGEISRQPVNEFAFSYGLSKFYGSAGWASYERNFVVWAEEQGYQLDVVAQHDLHTDASILDGYSVVVVVGHDEYWTWEMRDVVDKFVDDGGHVARFAGNFATQVRLEDDASTQICYRREAAKLDPVGPHSSRLTGAWELASIGRPGALTFGLNGGEGAMAGIGGLSSQTNSSFITMDPDAWIFRGLNLTYGDLVGDSPVFGYEVDGLEFTMQDGRPVPTGRNCPEGVEIFAVGFGTWTEPSTPQKGEVFGYGDASAFVSWVRYGSFTENQLAAATRGNGMIASYRRGKGEVLNIGTANWVEGLLRRDAVIEGITRNVLDEFLSREPQPKVDSKRAEQSE